MSDTELVRLERRDDGVAVITIDNPKVNALSEAVLRGLIAVTADLRDDPPGAVVVTGNDRMFAAGADIAEFTGPDRARELGLVFREAFDGLADLPRVVIAAISGFALGGGCELALACDFRIAATSARLGQPEILLGIIPGAGGTQRLPRLVGVARAKDLILSGRRIRAEEALGMGLVDRVVQPDEVMDTALSMAAEFARGPLAAHALAKHSIDRGLDITLSGGLDLEQQVFVQSFRSEDAVIGLASFLENGPGKARFTGR